MSKKVLAIVSSPRKNGNTELLVDEFVKGAQEAGHGFYGSSFHTAMEYIEDYLHEIEFLV